MKRIAPWLLGGSVAALVLTVLCWLGWLAHTSHSYRKSFSAYEFVSARPYTWQNGTPAVKGFVGDREFGFWDGGEGTAVTIRVAQANANRFKPGCIVGSDYDETFPDGTWVGSTDLKALVLDVDQSVVTLLVEANEPTRSQLISAFKKGCVQVRARCG